jgi:hypothetical protein
MSMTPTTTTHLRIPRNVASHKEVPHMARITQNGLDTMLVALNGGEKIEDIPTFEHEVNGVTYTSPVIIRCAQSGRFNPVAKVEGGAYVEDVTYVGRDRTSKNGFYRIDKQADKENQSAWRAKRAAALEAAKEAGVVDEDNNVIESPEVEVEVEAAPAPRKRTRKQSAA